MAGRERESESKREREKKRERAWNFSNGQSIDLKKVGINGRCIEKKKRKTQVRERERGWESE